ncbi:MAG: hypothetical protein ACJ75B_06760 [Flavisolibacter sp.]
MEFDEKTSSIDSAIKACETTITTHRRSSSMLLLSILFTLAGFFSYFLFIYQDSRYSYKDRLTEAQAALQKVSNLNDSLNTLLPDSLKLRSFHLANKPKLESVKPENGTNFINYGIYLSGVVIISILTAL